MSNGTSGALSELRACADLLIKGFEVFRAVSPSCSCDLMIRNGNKYLTIEVRTAYTTHTGAVVYSKKRIRADHVAAVFPSEVVYFPLLPTQDVNATLQTTAEGDRDEDDVHIQGEFDVQ